MAARNQKAAFAKGDTLRCTLKKLPHEGVVVQVKTFPDSTASYKLSPFGPFDHYWITEEELMLVKKAQPETAEERRSRLESTALAKEVRAETLEEDAKRLRRVAAALYEEARKV